MRRRAFHSSGPVRRASESGQFFPPGVTLRDIDGGPTYYADNGFTKATASRTVNGTTHTNGCHGNHDGSRTHDGRDVGALQPRSLRRHDVHEQGSWAGLFTTRLRAFIWASTRSSTEVG